MYRTDTDILRHQVHLLEQNRLLTSHSSGYIYFTHILYAEYAHESRASIIAWPLVLASGNEVLLHVALEVACR